MQLRTLVVGGAVIVALVVARRARSSEVGERTPTTVTVRRDARIAIPEVTRSAAIRIEPALDDTAATLSSTQGALRGRIRDATTGEHLAGVTVVATSPALDGAQTAISDDSGRYQLGPLPEGTYTVTLYYVELTIEYQDIAVAAREVARIDGWLETPVPTFEPRYEDPDDPRYLEVGVSFSSGTTVDNVYVID